MLSKYYESANIALVIFLCCFILLVGCSLEDPELRNNIQVYFDSESTGDWGKVYSLRTSSFRNTVKKADFISDMQDASNGWQVLKYSIDNISIIGNRAEVTITFLEKPPKSYWEGSGMQPSNISQQASSIWVKEAGDGWRCKESPSRSYLPYSQ
jgi:hypothetical protein